MSVATILNQYQQKPNQVFVETLFKLSTANQFMENLINALRIIFPLKRDTLLFEFIKKWTEYYVTQNGDVSVLLPWLIKGIHSKDKYCRYKTIAILAVILDQLQEIE